MEKFKGLFSTAIISVLFYSVSTATVIKVDDLGDNAPINGGTMYLRQAISIAASGDTIMMDVSGQINLSTPISINVPVVILGAYPIHSKIVGSGGDAFTINNITTDTVIINGFSFSGFGGGTAAISIMNSLVRIGDCVFENNSGSANGQAISVNGASSDLKVFSTSFFNNTTTSEGGAIEIGAGSDGSIFNCTFFQNSASSGGAISLYGVLNIINNTFINNTATNGKNISRNTGSSITLANNIFSNPSGANAFFNSGPNWNNLGGNVHTFNPPAFIPVGGDMTGLSQAGLLLQGTPTTDGYGLKYFRITQQTSPAVDNGVMPAALPTFDCRRAPRVIYGDNGLLPDAGASEFTPYRVTSTLAPNDFETVWIQMNLLGGSGGPEYMEFELPGLTNFVLTSTMSYTANPPPRIVDGYTNSGSGIAGPRDPFVAGSYIVPANINVNLIVTVGGVLDIDIWPVGSWIAGLKLDNGPGNGILMTDCQMQFYGNHVMSSANNGLNGIVVNGFSSDVLVGGNRYHEMNVIGGQNNSVASSGINIGGVNTKVLGNFIGTTTNGFGTIPNAVGISVQPNPGINFIGGNYNEPSRNLISGNTNGQIKLMGPSDTKIRGNIIGTDISTTAPLGASVAGIDVFTDASAEIGGLAKGDGNIFGFNTTALILNSGNAPLTIFGNYIGISPYVSNGYTLIPNSTGGIVVQGGLGSVAIGNGTLAARNYISGNNGVGIYFDSADQHLISGNFVGVKPDHTPAPNTSHGIHLVNTSSINQLLGNIVSANGGTGIYLNGAGSANLINGNKIGIDSAGTGTLGNASGIALENTQDVIVSFNQISGNIMEGISGNNLMYTNIHHNVIGLDATSSGGIPNGTDGIFLQNTYSIQIDTNVIAANNMFGVAMLNGYDLFMAGNLIGTNSSGAFFGNVFDGIYLENTKPAKIGGTGTGNTIANNGRAGIKLRGSDSVEIKNNKIYNNVELGISINDSPGVTANDLNDADATGALLSNGGQNFPVLNAPSICNATTTNFTGTINVDDATSDYYLEFFIVNTPDATGYGEGDSLLFSAAVNPGGLNTFNFNLTYAGVVPVGTIISATCSKDLASSGYYQTSEFSDTAQVRGGFTADATVINNVLCNGDGNGSALVTNNSGIGPITYQWYNAGSGSIIAGQINDTAFALLPGNYFCMVTDGTSCTVLSDTITITEPAILNTTLTVFNETCAGLMDGGADIVVNSGGTPNYNFDWYDSGALLISSTGNVNTGATIGISMIPPGNYFTVITDANGCDDTLTYVVAPGVSVNAAFSPAPSTVCQGGTVAFADGSTGSGAITAWSYDFGDSNTSTAQNPTNVYLTSGAFTVVFIAFSGTCSDTANSVINVLAQTTSTAGVDLSVCEGTPVTVSGATSNAISFNWSTNGAGTFSNPTALTSVYTNGASDVGSTIEIYFTANSSGTCPNATDTLLLTVDALPTVNAGADQTICSGNTVTINGIATNAPTITWSSSGSGSFANAFSLVTTYTPSAADISAGTITLNLQTSANGACAAVNDALVLTINPGPTTNAGADVDVCRTGTVFITLGGAVTNASSFSWSTSGSGSWVNGTTLTPDYYFSGADVSGANTTLYLTAFAVGCPSVTDSLLITYFTAPSAFAGIDDTVCASSPAVSLNGGATNQASVIWTNGGGTYNPDNISLTTLYNPTAAEILSGSLNLFFTAVATNAACPDNTDTMNIVFLTSPNSNAGADATICQGSSFTLDGSGSTGTFSGLQWSQVGGGVIGNTITTSVNPTSTTSYVLALDNVNCFDYDTVTISVENPPTANFGNDTSICVNTNIPLTCSCVNVFTGFWTTSGTGSFSPSPSTINATYIPSVGDQSAGSVQLIFTSTSAIACSNASDTFNVTINQLPDPSFTTGTPYCESDTAENFIPVTPGGSFTGTGITDGTLGTFDPGTAGAGTFPITYVITDANSCTNSTVVNVVVNANPVVTLTTIATSWCTSDSPITLSGTPPGGIFTLNSTILTGGIFDPSTTSPGVDTITYFYMDANTCVGYDYQLISVSSGPPPPGTSNTAINYCQGSTINPLVVTSSGTVIWYNDAALTIQIGTGTTLPLPQNLSGVNVFYVTQTVGSCTSQPTVITVTVIDGSVLNLGGPFLVCPDQSVQLNVLGATGTVIWTPGNTLSDSTILNPIATPTFTTTYYVSTLISGCNVTDSVTVNVDPACLENVYNAFSPNGDGTNDTWIIEGAFTNTNNRVMIFNRWGDKLIELNDYDNVTVVWDGTYKGNNLPAGTYFYIIEYIDLQQQFNGWVQITK